MIVKHRFRRDTAADWASVNPILGLGEPGLETDTRLVKYGDGVTAWDSLAYSAVLVAWGDISGTLTDQTDLATALNDKISSTEKGAVSGVATLDAGGKIPSSQLPLIALVDVTPVASQSAQLALTAQKGDVAVRTDQNKSYMHNGGTAGTMADWQELLTPTDTVLSVNGQTGVVTLGAALSKTDDTNVTITLGGSASTSLVNAASITLGWNGQLAAGRGGTGSAFVQFTGPTTSIKTFTLPNGSDTIAVLGVAQSWSAQQTFTVAPLISVATPIVEIRTSVTGSPFGIKFTSSGTQEAIITQQPSNGEFIIDAGRSVGWGGKIIVKVDTAEVARFTSAGFAISSGYLGYGQGSGAGGTVTQGTSRTTGVTLNKATGRIVLFSAAGSTTWQTFTVSNSIVGLTDTIIVNQRTGADKYMIFVTNITAGTFDITFATTGGTTVEAPQFNFSVIKGSQT